MMYFNAKLIKQLSSDRFVLFHCFYFFPRSQGDTMINVCVYNTEDRAIATQVYAPPPPKWYGEWVFRKYCGSIW